MKMRAAVVLLAALLLPGCGGGPDAAALRKDLGDRLGEALPAGTVTLVSLERRGSQADTKAPAGETRRIVYFDAQLRLQHDFEFGAWDAPGVAGVVSALGAGPKGLAGISSSGNKTGDVLRAHGTAVYRRDGDRWVPLVTGGYRPSVAHAYPGSTPQGPAAILEAMRKAIDSMPKNMSTAQHEAISQELAAAHTVIRARLTRAADGYAIAAGPEHGQYMRFAKALVDESGDLRTVPLLTRGGEENLRLLRAGKVTLALAQADAALEAYEGKGNFASDGPYSTLRAVGSLYPEPVHVIVRADSAFASLSDLKGRRVAIGEEGSASRSTALRVLAAHRLKDIVSLELGLGDALVALRSKEADAVIQVIGVPADSVRNALAEVPLRLLPLSERAVAALVKAEVGYFPYTIPRGAYATQKDNVRSVATAALLLARPDLSETEVARVAHFVFAKGRDFAALGSAQGTQVSAATARHGLSIPMHIGAAKVLDTR